MNLIINIVLYIEIYSGIIPFALLHVCLVNRRSSRVVLVNGKVAENPINKLAGNRCKDFLNQQGILRFNKKRLSMLKVRCLGGLSTLHFE